MNAVAKAEQNAVAEADNVLSVIERAALNPAIDVDKLDKLLAMQERIIGRQAEQAFNAAMNDAQSALGPVAADATNPQTRSRYASYPALDKAVRPIYTRHGFALSFNTADGAPADHVRVVCSVSHRDGHKALYQVDMPSDGKGAKGNDVMTKTHATGAAFSYGQRYLLKLIFNIAVGDDDDGNSNGGREMSAGAQAAIAAVNACKTIDDLRAWKAANGNIAAVLSAHETAEIIRLVNDRVRKLKEAAE
jgi:hypothetical protein